MASAWQQSYDRHASGYARELDATLVGAVERVVELAEARPTMRLLDLATGTGTIARAAAALGASVVAIDASAGMLEVARRLSPELDLRRSDACALPFGDGEFDVVTWGLSLSHFDEREKALREALRVLAARRCVRRLGLGKRQFSPHSGGGRDPRPLRRSRRQLGRGHVVRRTGRDRRSAQSRLHNRLSPDRDLPRRVRRRRGRAHVGDCMAARSGQARASRPTSPGTILLRRARGPRRHLEFRVQLLSRSPAGNVATAVHGYGAFMEHCGRNRRQPVADGTAGATGGNRWQMAMRRKWLKPRPSSSSSVADVVPERIRWAVETLAIEPDDRLLEMAARTNRAYAPHSRFPWRVRRRLASSA
jgi:SAM-dependent methyltransferase